MIWFSVCVFGCGRMGVVAGCIMRACACVCVWERERERERENHLSLCIHLTVLLKQQGQRRVDMAMDYRTSKHLHHSGERYIPASVSAILNGTSPWLPSESTLYQSGSHCNWCWLEPMGPWKQVVPKTTTLSLNENHLMQNNCTCVWFNGEKHKQQLANLPAEQRTDKFRDQ